jgi:hypothetical protein
VWGKESMRSYSTETKPWHERLVAKHVPALVLSRLRLMLVGRIESSATKGKVVINIVALR